MAFTLYQGGLGGSTGDSLATNDGPLLATKVIYVDSVTGNTAYSGLQRDRPKATLEQGNSIAVDGCIIVLLSTHTETISSLVTIGNNYVTVVGEGSSSGVPTATLATTNINGISVEGFAVQLRNIKLATSTSANTEPRIKVTGARFSAIGLYCESSGTDEDAAIDLRTLSTDATVKNCTFVSTATVATDLPTYGLLVSSGNGGLELDGCVFDDGTYGFSAYACYGSGTLPNIRAENISLLRGAEMRVTGYGYVHVGTATGGGRVTEA